MVQERKARRKRRKRPGQLIERELKRLGLEPSAWMTDDKLQEAANKFTFNDIEDMLSAVGFGGITAAQICTKLTEKMRKEAEEAQHSAGTDFEMKEMKPAPARRKTRPTQGVSVKGVDNLLVRFARCCNPVPGDDIVGYITRGRGVSVHRQDCHEHSDECRRGRSSTRDRGGMGRSRSKRITVSISKLPAMTARAC